MNLNQNVKFNQSQFQIKFLNQSLMEICEQDPIEPSFWKDVRDATEFPPRCIQSNVMPGRNTSHLIGQEDCLYLNVFTPQVS